MYFCDNYALAVVFCVVTMFCWGSWGNTQKLAGKTWRYELFYWDYVIGVVLFALVSGLTAGSMGANPDWGFVANLRQASAGNLGSAFLGGIVFNAANILLAAAISIAGMSVAFPVGIGLALVLGVVVNYIGAPKGDPALLFGGVALIVIAILCNAFAYKIKTSQTSQASQTSQTLLKGIVLSVVCGVLMAFFYRFIACTMDMEFSKAAPAAGMMTPYSAFFVFTLGIFASNFIFNAIAMRRPVSGEPITERDYFKGRFPIHLVGVLGGLIWGLGNGINLVAAGKAGAAISYGLGQGATLVSALWGILIWKEFKGAPKKAGALNLLMFVLFVIGLGLIIVAGNSDADCSAVSPDGRNEIRLGTDPLTYEVRRDGVVVVAKSEIGLKVDGTCLVPSAACQVRKEGRSGFAETPVYKKARIDLSGNETFVDFGDWGVRLAARNDGVAYRFETKRPGEMRVDGETANVALPPDARGALHTTFNYGCEEVPVRFGALVSLATNEFAYLPAAFSANGKFVVVTESDVCDYPVWNLSPRGEAAFAGCPAETYRSGLAGWDASVPCEKRARWEIVRRREGYLVKTGGTRTFPWRTFILADSPADVLSADIVRALARPAEKGADFSWVKPGKVTWEWWNAWNNIGDPLKGGADGCTTETYRRFFDLAAEYGVEYVIFDEGWSKKLDIWHLNENVDLKGLVDYGNRKGVGTILWMAWGQIVGEEERVAREFAKLGVRGFKVDFMDRGDAACERFYWDFAKACAKYKLVVDYHGAHRPTGLSHAYPNVLNYEGVHGLEQMKFYRGQDILANDVAICFTRMSAGPMDYTPGAMDNYPVGKYPSSAEKDVYTNPGSLGTRCRQMAMMALYEAPLQMLCDAPVKYRKNAECFSFMAKTPVVWDDTVGLGGSPDTFAALARRKGDVWYVAAITDRQGRDFSFTPKFLGEGAWTAEVFRDADDADANPTHFVHETGKAVRPDEPLSFHMASGGGLVLRFSKGG